jgi:hypothetical protein
MMHEALSAARIADQPTNEVEQMQNPIENAIDHSRTLYLANKAPETRDVLDALIDYAEGLRAVLEDLVEALEGVTPTEAEFLNETATIDQDAWDDLDEAVREARDALGGASCER